MFEVDLLRDPIQRGFGRAVRGVRDGDVLLIPDGPGRRAHRHELGRRRV